MTREHEVERTSDAPRQLVRFVGGPWDGDASRYYGLADYPDVVTSGGRYCLREAHRDGHVVYAFRHHRESPLP